MGKRGLDQSQLDLRLPAERGAEVDLRDGVSSYGCRQTVKQSAYCTLSDAIGLMRQFY